MNFKRLYVIGNGFDLHYGIESSYGNFKKFLLREDPGFYYALEDVCHGDLWKDFETALGQIRRDAFTEDIFGMQSSVNPNSDDPYAEQSVALDYQLEAAEEEFDVEKLKELFERWVKGIDISGAESDGLIEDTDATAYLSFNYTETVEEIYDVPSSRMLHIHGKRDEDDLVIGHKEMSGPDDEEEVYEHYQEGELKALRDRFVSETTKPVKDIISDNRSFFDQLSEVDEVIFMGFSFGEVDLPYIAEIRKSVSPKCSWTIYSRHVDDRDPWEERPIVGLIRQRKWRTTDV